MDLVVVILQKIFKELRCIREELLARNLYDLGSLNKQDYIKALREEVSGLEKEEKKNGY